MAPLRAPEKDGAVKIGRERHGRFEKGNKEGSESDCRRVTGQRLNGLNRGDSVRAPVGQEFAGRWSPPQAQQFIGYQCAVLMRWFGRLETDSRTVQAHHDDYLHELDLQRLRNTYPSSLFTN